MKNPHRVSIGWLNTWIAVLAALAVPVVCRAQMPPPTPAPMPAVQDPPPVLNGDGSVNADLVIGAANYLASLKATDRSAYVRKLRATLETVRAELSAAKANGTGDRVAALTLLESALSDLLATEHPDDLRIDIYGATVSSTLYHEDGSTGQFGKARPYLEIQIRQTFRRSGSNRGWDIWGTITAQTAAFAPAQAPTPEAGSPTLAGRIRTASNDGVHESIHSFTVEAGTEHGIPTWFHNDNVRLGVLAGLSLSSFESTAGDTDLRPQDRNYFMPGGRAGIVVRQIAGSWRGTFSEFSYLRDPRFRAADRLLIRGRLVLTPTSGEGEGLGVYLEGSMNAGRGRDEARLVIGIRLDTLAILRAIVGGKPSAAPG